ncbi:MAG: hypothetical protein V4489_04765 [Chlamydiota bacterium]
MINLKVRSDSVFCDLKINVSFSCDKCRFEVLTTGEENTSYLEISHNVQSVLARLDPRSFGEITSALTTSGIEVISGEGNVKQEILFQEIIKNTLVKDRREGVVNVYNPSYIPKRVSDRFTNQQDYLNRSRQVISSTVKMMTDVRHENSHEAFFQILSFLSAERHAIAVAHQTEGADEFGSRRDLEKERFVYTLSLGGAYDQCGKSITDWMARGFSAISDQFPDIKPTRKGAYQQQVDCLGYKSRLLFEICDAPELSKWRNVKRAIILKCFPKETANFLLDKLNKEIPFSEEELKMYKEAKALCCKEDLEIRSHVDMLEVLTIIEKRVKNPEMLSTLPPKLEYHAFFLRATASIGMNDAIQPLTTYNALAYIKKNRLLDGSDPICMRCPILLHQPPELIQTTLEESAKVFQKIMDWDGNDLNSLQEQMGLLTYLLVHNMRDVRGSAAETEWFTHAIYEALGVLVTTNEAYLQDLEAFAHPLLPDFIDRYKMLYSLKLREPTS